MLIFARRGNNANINNSYSILGVIEATTAGRRERYENRRSRRKTVLPFVLTCIAASPGGRYASSRRPKYINALKCATKSIKILSSKAKIKRTLCGGVLRGGAIVVRRAYLKVSHMS